ncbi:transcription factor, partial [Irpex lacteus]
VRVGDKKYACETCIKGHRSSTCKHTDRPLFEIKKKGRPVTQCEHCRELRKTKQVHVKCMCGAKDQPLVLNEDPSGKKVPVSATFPSGLPETLGASAAVLDGSDSEPGESIPSPVQLTYTDS